MNARDAAREIFGAGIAAVNPELAARQAMTGVELPANGKVYVLGAGKAAASMARGVESVLGERIAAGLVVVKYGHGVPLERIAIKEAAHPIPDANSFRGAAELLDLARQAKEDDLVICVLSGGASALATDCVEGVTPSELMELNRLLVHCGARISEINAVRKHLSQIKGGQLARAAYPARVMTLILSDVIGDELEVIASGPTAPDSSTYADALGALEKYTLLARVAPAIVKRLRDGAAGIVEETPKRGDPIFQRTTNRIVGNNSMALDACQTKAVELGFAAQVVDRRMEGDAVAAARAMVEAIRAATPKSCLLFGGETTVHVMGDGLGGRNQHLALAAATLLEDLPGVTILAGGTDGTDGPTDAAGAVVDADTVAVARELGLEAAAFLERFDSYRFFQQVGGHVITGPTRTNVMDLAIAIRQ